MFGFRPFVLALSLWATAGCGKPPAEPTGTVKPPAEPTESLKPGDVFDLRKLQSIGSAITKAQEEKRLPGGVLWVERNGVHFTKAYGKASMEPTHSPAKPDTIYDAASLTKVVATTTAVLLLHERAKLSIDDSVRKHLPEFTEDGRNEVTLLHLLTHTSGLRPDISLAGWNGHAECIAKCVAEKLQSKPGQKFKYSDINFQLLDEIIRRVTKRRLDLFCEKEIFGPLKMIDTGYNPPVEKRPRVAPTTVKDGKALQSMVHDPRARKTEGVAGHAGLFTTAPDLARFARMLLQEGELDGVRLFKPETVKLMTTVQTPSGLPRRGLGWDIDSGYSSPRGRLFPLGSYGHTGFTGTSIWIDPFSKTFVIFLCNRVHPTEKGPNVSPLRRVIGTLAAEAVKGFDFADVPGALPARKRP
ncbi:MAG: serine hydrolase [Opitutae bacterium]|nr:serine hydrolase [Opitutae bacterium]|tara:strand:- start:3223 stop:4464 length:1242 start_codon:yes stop_codon:yes gene_type:complete